MQTFMRSKMAAGWNGRKSKWDIPSSEANGSSKGGGSASSASDAARERAAKLNAMLAAKGKLAKGTAPAPLVPATSAITSAPKQLISRKETQFSDQDLFTAEVEINDSPSRVILCKGLTQDEINRCSGAAVSTRGKYLRHSEKVTAEENGEKPLYLCIQGTNQAKVDLAVKRIRAIMAGADIYGKFSGSYAPPANQPSVTSSFHSQPLTPSQNLPPGMHYVQEKLFVGLDYTPPEFNLKEKLLGPAGSYFQHITMETGAKVHLRGRGSGFIEPTSGKEAFEALYVYISHNKVEGLSAAKKLAESLIQTVHTEFKAFEQANTVHNFYADPFQQGYPPAPHPPAPGYQTPYGYLTPARYPLPSGAPPPPGSFRVAPLPGHYYNQLPASEPHEPSGHLPPMPAPFRDPPPPPGQGFPYPSSAVPPASGPYPQCHALYPGPPPPSLSSTSASHAQPEYNQINQPPQPVTRAPIPQPSNPSSVPAPAPAPPPAVPVPPPPKDPPKRRFTEKAPIKSSGMETTLGNGPSDKSSVSPLLGPLLNQGRPTPGSYPHQKKCRQQSWAPADMPPPVAAPLKGKPKLKEDVMPPPPSLKESMPHPALSSKLQGKRQGSTKLAFNRETKKAKAEEEDTTVTALVPLVAYGDDDSSSDEDEVQSPQAKGGGIASSSRGTGNQQGSLPFWAVRRP